MFKRTASAALTTGGPIGAPWRVRRAEPPDLPVLSDLCLRSKAVWGYDAAFLEACRAELTLTVADLAASSITVLHLDGEVYAMAQVVMTDAVADLAKLFVAPERLKAGYGRVMFEWAVLEARRQGAQKMTIETDPYAAPFYEAMGAHAIATAPSGSIPGRHLPVYLFTLDQSVL